MVFVWTFAADPPMWHLGDRRLLAFRGQEAGEVKHSVISGHHKELSCPKMPTALLCGMTGDVVDSLRGSHWTLVSLGESGNPSPALPSGGSHGLPS